MIDICLITLQSPGIVVFVLFRSVFSLPFIGVPLIMATSMGIWITAVVGYLIPLIFMLCFMSKFKCKNPRYNNNENQSDTNVNNENKNTIIWNWLNDIGLTEYYEILIKEGYQSLNDIHTISAKDLNDLNISKQMHVKKILNKINSETGKKAETDTGTVKESGEGNAVQTLTIDIKQSPPNDENEAPPAYANASRDHNDELPQYNQVTNY